MDAECRLFMNKTACRFMDTGSGKEKNWVVATNSDFLITISLEPNVTDLRYFKLWILLDLIIWVWNIKGLQHRVLKILTFKYLILFQRLNSFGMKIKKVFNIAICFLVKNIFLSCLMSCIKTPPLNLVVCIISFLNFL